MQEVIYAEVAVARENHHGERICGDNFVLRRPASGLRTLAVLSDGLGHGIRANILSNLTSTMLAGFTSSRTDAFRVSTMLDAMLPVNRATNISYATFTVADVNNATGDVTVMQYDNPNAFLIRQGQVSELEWSEPYSEDIKKGRPGRLLTARFRAREGDRLVMVTDGVTQSGQRSAGYRFGWGGDHLRDFSRFLAGSNQGISSEDLASQIISKAYNNDRRSPSDDMTCAVITFRLPRRMMLVSCPPALAEDSDCMSRDVTGFDGAKVICGQPVAEMLASYIGRTLELDERSHLGSEFPLYKLPGFDIVTDGMIVPGRVLEILEHPDANTSGGDVPSRIVRMLLRNDSLHIKIGMRRNIDPHGMIPDEFSLRRNILRRIIDILEKKYGKKVETRFF